MKHLAHKAILVPVVALACVGVMPALGGCGCSRDSEPAAQEQVADVDSSKSDSEKATAEATSKTDATDKTSDTKTSSKTSKEDERLDVLVLVNKEYALPDGWEDELELVGDTNVKGDYVEVDKIAYDAFSELKEDLEENEGITIDLNSGYRSVEEQEEIRDNLLQTSGEEYVRTKVAVPGHSEHHTGLALDALLVDDGEPVVTQEDIDAHAKDWRTIHEHLAKHGFILRYLKDREDVTGYPYEQWHIRYVGEDAAKEIMREDEDATLDNYQDSYLTLEEYLDKVPDHSVAPGAESDEDEDQSSDQKSGEDADQSSYQKSDEDEDAEY